MTLKEWVVSQGGARVVAPRLNVKADAVRQWLRGKSSPTAKACFVLIKLSEGQLTFEQVFTESTRNKQNV